MAEAEYARDRAAELFTASVAALKSHIDAEDFDKALKSCNKAFELNPEETTIRRCKVFVLLNLSRWSEALALCEKFRGDGDDFKYETAYCLYRLNRFKEALDIAGAASFQAAGGDRAKRLEAQLLYGMGDYVACADMYQTLHDDDPEETGLLVNSVASRVSGNQARQAVRMMADSEELLETSYELCFNLACAHIEDGELGKADARLQEARELCLAELLQAEELGEDAASQLEDHEELAAIAVQRGVVLQRKGGPEERKEAQALYARVLSQRPGRDVDASVQAVAANNVVTLRSQGSSLFDSLKRINTASKAAQEHKLTRKQAIEIAINKCLLLLQASRLDEARRELQRLRDTYPGDERVAVVQAAIIFKEKKAKGCEDFLLAYLSDHPGSQEVLLCLSILHTQQGKPEKAAEALAQLPKESRAQPQMVQAIAGLHHRQRNFDKAVACLREAIEYWSGEEGEEAEEMLASVLRMAARLAAQLKDRAFAAEAYRLYLERVDGSDVEALCGLVKALASTEPEKAAEYAQRLQVPSHSHLDAEELEAGPMPKLASSTLQRKRDDKDGKEAAVKGEGAEGASKAKKKRKPRYPKNFDPENPGPAPDPERWLPKNQRSEFKKKMRKRDKNLARGPQGSMPADDAAFRKAGPSTAQVEVATDGTKRGKKNKGKK